jgi:phosphate transport system substrate-binding protein
MPPGSARTIAAGVLPAMFLCVAVAAVDPALPRYQPENVSTAAAIDSSPAAAATTLFGYNDMRELLEPLAERFAATHAGLRVAIHLPGTRFAPAALAAGQAALAPMGAEMTPDQRRAYRAATGDDPIEFRVAHASIDPRALSGPLGIFVHADNPITSVTFDQLSRALTRRAMRWGDLGVSGPWALRLIHVYGVQRGSPLAYAMQDAVGADAAFGTAMTGLPQSAEVVAHVAADPLGLGYAAAMHSAPGARMVPVARDAGQEALLPTASTISEGRYPLDRFLLVYARRPLSPFAREFLRLMLSSEGQEAVAQTPQRYLPLSAAEAAVERAKLDAP